MRQGGRARPRARVTARRRRTCHHPSRPAGRRHQAVAHPKLSVSLEDLGECYQSQPLLPLRLPQVKCRHLVPKKDRLPHPPSQSGGGSAKGRRLPAPGRQCVVRSLMTQRPKDPLSQRESYRRGCRAVFARRRSTVFRTPLHLRQTSLLPRARPVVGGRRRAPPAKDRQPCPGRSFWVTLPG